MDYAQLQADIADWLNREDLVGAVPSFIRLTEADLAKRVRHWRMEKRSNAPLDSRFSALPPDWVETIRLELTAPVRRLELGSSAVMLRERERSNGAAGIPRYYAHTGGSLELCPAPQTEMAAELVYYAKLPALTAQAPTNWLLDEAPAAYLYGALIQSAPYLKDDARIPVWQGLYEQAITATNAASERSTWSGGGLRLQTRPTP